MSSFLFFAFTTDDFFCRAPELALGQDRYRDLFHQSPSLIAVLLISVSALGRRVGHPPVLRQRWFSSDSLQIKKIARNAEDYFSFFPWHNGKGFPGTCHRLTFLVSYWHSTCLEDLENTDSWWCCEQNVFAFDRNETERLGSDRKPRRRRSWNRNSHDVPSRPSGRPTLFSSNVFRCGVPATITGPRCRRFISWPGFTLLGAALPATRWMRAVRRPLRSLTLPPTPPGERRAAIIRNVSFRSPDEITIKCSSRSAAINHGTVAVATPHDRPLRNAAE